MAARQGASGLLALPDELLQRVFGELARSSQYSTFGPGQREYDRFDQRKLAQVAKTCKRFNIVLQQPLPLCSSTQ
ncbi:hypothetical protein WJX73_000366 [Symbiochloris irregularis]|uniref:F-box domain-containing protein n=1 Tax=Symbiochloris irregularis TaxID=706552 RepID=A0AAW1P2U7_9CHLO